MPPIEDQDQLAARFESQRSHLRGVAYRILGSLAEADDAVQEAWIRLSRTGSGHIDDLGAWLTTVVAHVCLNMLRSRKIRGEAPLELHVPDPVVTPEEGLGPEEEALLGDSVGLALLVVLDSLAPAERVAFVLHDVFAVPFDQIAPIVGRTPTATAPTRQPGTPPGPGCASAGAQHPVRRAVHPDRGRRRPQPSSGGGGGPARVRTPCDRMMEGDGAPGSGA